MREAYNLFGRRDDLTSRQDRLLPLDEFRVDDRALVFRVENQHVAEWAVPLARMAEDDPPVSFRAAAAGAGSGEWRTYLGRFSLACVEVILSEAVLSADEPRVGNRGLEPDGGPKLESRYTRLPFPEYPMWAVEDGVARWFAGPDVLLREDAGDWLWVLGRSEAAVDDVRAASPTGRLGDVARCACITGRPAGSPHTAPRNRSRTGRAGPRGRSR